MNTFEHTHTHPQDTYIDTPDRAYKADILYIHAAMARGKRRTEALHSTQYVPPEGGAAHVFRLAEKKYKRYNERVTDYSEACWQMCVYLLRWSLQEIHDSAIYPYLIYIYIVFLCLLSVSVSVFVHVPL